MGSLIWREGGKRLVVQWYDVHGQRQQETIRARSLDGTPLAKRTLERDARRRLAEHELQVDRQRAGLAPIWRGAVATTLYAGLREGEVFRLRKEDIDLRAGRLMVSRSWAGPRTKDGKALPVPIAAPLRPYLEEALRSRGPADATVWPFDTLQASCARCAGTPS